jgi:hypothetical protein
VVVEYLNGQGEGEHDVVLARHLLLFCSVFICLYFQIKKQRKKKESGLG